MTGVQTCALPICQTCRAGEAQTNLAPKTANEKASSLGRIPPEAQLAARSRRGSDRPGFDFSQDFGMKVLDVVRHPERLAFALTAVKWLFVTPNVSDHWRAEAGEAHRSAPGALGALAG